MPPRPPRLATARCEEAIHGQRVLRQRSVAPRFEEPNRTDEVFVSLKRRATIRALTNGSRSLLFPFTPNKRTTARFEGGGVHGGRQTVLRRRAELKIKRMQPNMPSFNRRPVVDHAFSQQAWFTLVLVGNWGPVCRLMRCSQ